MSRIKAREYLMMLLFQMDARKDYSEKQKEQFAAEHEIGMTQMDYFQTLCRLVIEHLEEIDHTLNKYTQKWHTNRMAKVDLAVLRLALGEIWYMDDAPTAAVIDAAVRIAKKFGGEDSSKFVNGILGKIVRDKQNAEKKEN